MADFNFLCPPCTQQSNPPREVVCLETGRFTVTGQEAGIPGEVPIGALGLRIMCPECRKQNFVFPTVHHYTCAKCAYKHETFVTGDTSEAPRGGIKMGDSDEAQQQSASILQQLRNGSISSGGGW